ncbi:HK97 family phage prohead protease [Alistipes sp. OttesenSCG-928-L06]|nr:HK97 family phage prohead protease [Alistipes sp. OttesenSCG-928-L06]
MEIRSFCEERAMPSVLENTRTIEGYAIVFEKESRMMFDWCKGRKFVEVIKREAVQNGDFAKWDIKALAEHDRSRLLARSFNGSGTLTLSVDDYGVKYRFDAPNTVEGDNAIELIKRGDIFGSSFAYTTDEESNVTYTKRADGSLLREVTKLDRVYDVSIVTDPAYFGTDVTVRNLSGLLDEQPVDESYKAEVAELRSLTK